MKPQYGNQIVLRTSYTTIQCRNRQQAEDNLLKWIDHMKKGTQFITFESRDGNSNITVVTEIVSMSVIDFEALKEDTIRQHREHNEIIRESELPDNE